MTRPGLPNLSEDPYQGLSFAGSLDPEPQDGRQIALVGQAWLGRNLLSVETGASAEGQPTRQDQFMLLQDPYA